MKLLERFWFGCGHCTGEESCPLLQDAAKTYEMHRWFRGPTLVGVALVIFIVPLASAIGGAFLAERLWADGTPEATQRWQIIGLFAGLIVGVALAKLLVHLSRISRHVCNDGGIE